MTSPQEKSDALVPLKEERIEQLEEVIHSLHREIRDLQDNI